MKGWRGMTQKSGTAQAFEQRPIPTIEGMPADKWWSKYSRAMRKAHGEKWLDIIDSIPDEAERTEYNRLLLKALQLAQLACMMRKRPEKMKAIMDKVFEEQP